MDQKIAAVIPCYRVKDKLLQVISAVGPEISAIYLVDDKCPEESVHFAVSQTTDSRVKALFHEKNQGVGGAMVTGYKAALADGADIVVKIDGDGQMDPRLVPGLIEDLLSGAADYTKGNRFFTIDSLSSMPAHRVFGNTVVSFLSKTATGYWGIMDPANGFTAIHSTALKLLPLDKLSKRYFFENDILFRLNTIRAVVKEFPMKARYADEKSSLKISKVIFEFPALFLNRFLKRIFYNYFLRNFNICSLQLVAGLMMLIGGSLYGAYSWYLGSVHNIPATTGTVMLAAVPVILGFQSILAAVNFDVMNIPKEPLQKQFKLQSFADEQAAEALQNDKEKVVQFPQEKAINR